MIFFFVLFFISNFSFALDCNFPGDEPLKWKDVNSCLYSLKFDEDIRSETIEGTLDLFNLYIYKDINTNSGDPYNIKTDVRKKLKALYYNDYEFDYDFQKDVQDILKNMKDAHTAYMPPYCYGGFVVNLPFIATSRIENDIQKIYVERHPLEIVHLNYTDVYPSFEDNFVSDFIGWEILKINNVDAFTFLYEYAVNEDSYSRDKAVRFNDALIGYFSHLCMRQPFPSTESVSMLISNGTVTKNIQPYYMISPYYDFTDGWSNACGYGSEKIRSMTIKDDDSNEERRSINANYAKKSIYYLENLVNEFDEDILLGVMMGKKDRNGALSWMNAPLLESKIIQNQRKRIQMKHEQESSFVALSTTESTRYKEVLTNADIQSYILNENDVKTGILVVKNFYPSGFYYEWVKIVQDSLKVFAEEEVTRLVVDVRKNGGGVVCLGYVLVRILSAYSPIAITPLGDMMSNDFWRRFYCKNNFLQWGFTFLTPERTPISSSWLQDPVERERGEGDDGNPIKNEYSHPFGLDCTVFRYLALDGYLEDTFGTSLQFEPENMIILTDGKCGSTCGMFIKLIQKLHLARIVNQGGIYKYPNEQEDMAICSFKAAAVMMSTAIYNQLDFGLGCILGLVCHCKRIERLPGYQIMTFSWYEAYDYDENSIFDASTYEFTQPMGYTKKKADYHLWNWNFNLDRMEDLEEVWDLVIPIFDGDCVDWEIKKVDRCMSSSSNIEHGVYGVQCTGGRFDVEHGACVLRGCEKGYYLNEDKSVCKEMPLEYDLMGYMLNVFKMISVAASVILLFFCFGSCFLYCICYCSIGWSVFAAVSIKERKKYRGADAMDLGYEGVLGDDEEEEEEEDDDDVFVS